MQTADHPFQALIVLVSLDQKIRHLGLEYEQYTSEISHNAALIDQCKIHLENSHKAMLTAQKKVDEQESIMQELDERVRKNKMRLDSISHHREYTSLKNEIETISHQQHAKEDELLAVWAHFEQLQKAYHNEQAQSEKTLQELMQKKQELVSTLHALQVQTDELVMQRPAKERLVPQEWLEKYVIMRTTTTDPIVPVVGQSCGTCFHALTHQEITRLGHRALLQCKGCYRLLFMPEAMGISLDKA